MLTSIWADVPGLRCIVGMKGKATRHFWFETTDAAMAQAIELDKDGWNVYFAPAVFDPDRVAARRQETNPRTGRPYTGREQATTHAMTALWLDLDCGEGKDYADQLEAAKALQTWLMATNVEPPSYVVGSGHGLHVYWLLRQSASHDHWLPVAKHLKQACRVHGLQADPARTADSASLLRPPGTHNHKRGHRSAVQVLVDNGTQVDLQQFRASLPVVGPLGAVPASTPAGEWDTTVKHPPGDAHKIADKCRQMGHMRFTKGKLSEPVWRAGLSVLWRCEDAETLIHTWSEGDERYTPEDTQAKAEGTKGPATCQHFSEINPEGCAGCPFAGKVTSPISLAYAESLPETEDDEEGTGPITVPGYTVTKEGVFAQPAAEGGPLTKIADFPIWIEEARELARAHEGGIQSLFILSWIDIRGRRYRAPITQAELHEPRSWTAWLADNNLASFVHGPQMANYISRMHKVRYRERGARVVYDSLGWYQDNGLFVTGGHGVTIDGVVDVVVDAKGPMADMHPNGSLNAWKAAIGVLGKPQYRSHAFALLAGFAAPLLDLVGKDGAVVAFVGESGRGKTLAAEAALSIFADPRKIRANGRDTANDNGVYLGQLRHVPALVDEVTTLSDKRMGELIYMAANGSDKGSLNQKRERRTATTWRTVTMLTSNHSIVDRPQSVIEEAHRRRLIEVAILDGVTKEDGALVGGAIQKHYGVAAAPYLQFVLQHKDKIPALFDVMERQVERWGYGNPEDRFGAWTCAAALLGGILAYLAGVLPFDPLPVVERITQDAARATDDISSPEEQAHDILFELLVTNSKRICKWGGNRSLGTPTDDPIARINGGELYVRSMELNEAWDEAHVFRRGLTAWLNRVSRGQTSMRLAPGTPPVRAYRFSLEALGWDHDSLTGE